MKSVWTGEWPGYRVTVSEIEYDVDDMDFCDLPDEDIERAVEEVRSNLPDSLTFEVDAESLADINASDGYLLGDMISDETGFCVYGFRVDHLDESGCGEDQAMVGRRHQRKTKTENVWQIP